MSQQYHGSCHCGAVKFSFISPHPITSGLRCNCSLCRKRGALMSDFGIHEDELTIEAEAGTLSLYEFGQSIAKHHFCNRCGVYPFHKTLRMPDHYRVNLGCVDEIEDVYALDVQVFDGKSL